MFNRMKNKLLITTALMALTCGHNAYADVTISSDTVLESEYTDNVIISGGNVTAKDSSTVNLNYPDGKNLTVKGGTLSLNDSTIHTFNGNTEISGDAVLNLNNNSDIDTNELTISGGTINLNKGELRQNNSFTMTGGIINMNAENGEVHIGSLGRDTEKVAGTVTSYAGGTTDISGGVINVNGGVGLGSSANDIYDNGNVIFGKSINVKDGAVINIKQGATLFAYENFQIDEPDLNNSDLDVVTFGNKGTIIMSADPFGDSTPVINLGGTLSANINGDDRGKIHLQNSNAQIDGNVEGASLIFEDSHTLSEAVTGTVGGLDIFEIQKGTLTYDKELDGGASSIWVDSGATLDIGTNALHSGGDKDYPGEGVHFKDNSTLKFTVTDKDTYGKIYANYVNISNNGTTLDMNLNSAALKEGDEPLKITLFNPEDNETVEIEGKFANLTSNSRYDFEDNGDGTYTVTANGKTASDVVAEAGGTTNNAATAEAWDSVSAADSSPTAAAVTEKLAQLSGSKNTAKQQAYVDALTAVAPEVAPMVQKTQTETANQVFSAVSSRLAGGSISTGSRGMSSGDSNPDAAVWVQGMYNHSELDDTSKAKGFDADSAGVAMGIEKNIGRTGKIGAGYAYTNTDIDGFMRNTDVDTHTAILYGEYKPSNWYVNGIATYGWSDYSEDKNVDGVGVKADYDVETLGLQAMTGYDINVNGLGITPEAGLRYVHIKQDAYIDSSDQKVSANDSDILTGVIGARFGTEAMINRCLTIKPEVRVAATYDIVNDDVNSVVTLANGSAYTVEGESLDRFGMEFGAGITAEINDKVEFSLGYEGKFRDNYEDHTGLINAKYKF